MKKIGTIVGSMLFFVAFISCNKEEPIPSYIHINNFTLNVANPVNQGSSSNKIVDAWIYIDDQLVGAFEMPCTVPVLFAGSHTIKILPGIKENGISDTRIPYPFYDRYEVTVDLVPGEILNLSPITTYAQAADFTWMEDFDSVGHSLCMNVGSSDTNLKMIQVPDPNVFEGQGSGGFFLTNTSTYFGVSCNKYTLPKAGAAVFLELNYNCNTDLNVGIRGYAPNNSLEYERIALTLRPSTGWNKIYVNLTNDVTDATSSSTFTIFFSMVKNPDLTTSYAYLDNIKLIN